MQTSLRLGAGAGFAGDRLDAALDLAERGELDYLILECLAERTIALAQLRRRRDPASGYDARLSALQFVCDDSLNGGVTTSLALDAHGKSLSFALLEMEI
jgi:hypothetical protein